MSILSGVKTAAKIIGSAFDVIDKAVPDKDLREKLKSELEKEYQEIEKQEIKTRGKIIVAESESGSWIKQNWRPITMLTFVGLVVAHWLGYTAENLSEPQIIALLDIIKVGIGGYVVGRSAEKVMKLYKG